MWTTIREEQLLHISGWGLQGETEASDALMEAGLRYGREWPAIMVRLDSLGTVNAWTSSTRVNLVG